MPVDDRQDEDPPLAHGGGPDKGRSGYAGRQPGEDPRLLLQRLPHMGALRPAGLDEDPGAVDAVHDAGVRAGEARRHDRLCPQDLAAREATHLGAHVSGQRRDVNR